MGKHHVFVYGTLRRGGVRAMTEKLPDSQFVVKAKVGGWLYDLLKPDKAGTYPGLRLDTSGSSVIGEIYEVDDKILEELDKIEEVNNVHPDKGLYFRRPVNATPLDGSPGILCWVYEFNPARYPNLKLIKSGDWIKYSRRRR
jgi:gamma-glutamylcyclotransferase (GGCT)/AIG2-like uncharacterized protein YtfP